MEQAKLSSMVSYDHWVQMLNRNTKTSDTVKQKPKTPSSRIEDKDLKMKREEKIPVSEMWIG